MRNWRPIRIVVFALAASFLATGCGGGLAILGLGIALSARGGGGGGGGVPAAPPFEVSILSVTSSGTSQYLEGDVEIIYRISHPDGARIRARVEHALGGAYAPCIQGGGDPIDAPIDIGPTPIEMVFIWPTRAQGLPVRAEDLRLRVAVDPEGGGAGGSAEYPPAGQGGLSLDNAEPPTIEIVRSEIASDWRGAPGDAVPIVAGTVRIPFRIADAEEDPAEWRAEVRIGSGAWASVASDAIQPTSQGARGELSWDSRPVLSEVVSFRIAAEDRYAGRVKEGIPAEVSLRAENRAPEIASIEPGGIPAYGEQRLRIRAAGIYADDALQVLVGGGLAAIDAIDADEPAIRIRTSLRVSGRYPVVVVNPNGLESEAVEIVAERVVSAAPGEAEFGSLGAAIEDARVDGESDATIHVLPGTYEESIAIEGASLVLRALASSGDPGEPTPRDLHVIRGGGGSPAIAIERGGPRIRGFTIAGGAGGIRASNCEGLVVEGCAIRDASGPGIDIANSRGIAISGCALRRNATPEDGGGVRLYRASGRIEDTEFSENEADRGGALSILWPSSDASGELRTIISGVHIVGNRARSNGGGIFIEGFPETPVVLAASLLDGNVAGMGGDGSGGAIYFNRGLLRIVHATIAGNRAFGGQGGGIYAAAPAEPEIARSIVAWNETGGSLGQDIAPRPARVLSTFVFDPPDLAGSILDPPEFLRPGRWTSADPSGEWEKGEYGLAKAAPAGDGDGFDPTAWGLSADDIATDIEGTPRDEEPDIGAYEWIGP